MKTVFILHSQSVKYLFYELLLWRLWTAFDPNPNLGEKSKKIVKKNNRQKYDNHKKKMANENSIAESTNKTVRCEFLTLVSAPC